MFLLIDVREDSEWQQGHLPTAIHLSKGIIERDIEAKIADLNAPIVLYCGGGYRSALAAEICKKWDTPRFLQWRGDFDNGLKQDFILKNKNIMAVP